MTNIVHKLEDPDSKQLGIHKRSLFALKELNGNSYLAVNHLRQGIQILFNITVVVSQLMYKR